MGMIGIFFKPRKYDFRSGYMKDRKDAMMERVEKICKTNEIEMGIKSETIPMITRNRKRFVAKPKNSFIFVAFVLLILICVLLYLIIRL